MFIFVGEKRSNRAKVMGVTWNDGHLAAKTLFNALSYAEISLDQCHFINLWSDDGKLNIQLPAGIVIGMGRKVQRELEKNNIEHIKLIHPAARGKIRKTRLYCEHVKNTLKGLKPCMHYSIDLKFK